MSIYFDHAASTPPEEEVVQTILEVMRTYYGNPSSLHRAGKLAEQLLLEAAGRIARMWGADQDEVIFTSGGTESNNLAIFGTLEAFPKRGAHLITTAIEHSSVYECFRKLERQGYEVSYVQAGEDGAIRAEDVEAALRPDTSLVSIMHVNNETGAVQPIEEIGRLLERRRQTVFHVDAVQAAGKLPLRPGEHGIDLMSVSAHKFGGPKGIGALYRRRSLAIAPQLVGGGQQQGFRSGTENVPLIVGMAKAYRLAEERMKQRTAQIGRYRRMLTGRLVRNSRIRLTGPADGSGMAPHIVHFRVPGVRAEVFLHALEQRGFLVSSQSACSSGEEKPSRVLLAMGLSETEAKSGIRISLSHHHAEHEVQELIAAIEATMSELEVSATWHHGS